MQLSISLFITIPEHPLALLSVHFDRHREYSNQAAPQPLPVILPLHLSLGQKLSSPLSLPTVSPVLVPQVPSEQQLLAEQVSWLLPPQHLCFSRAIFSCWL